MVIVVAVLLVVLVLPSVVDDDSSESEVEAVSEIASSELAHEFIFRLKKKISKISIITSFRFEIFFNEKEMRMLSIPNAVNIISHFGIMERSCEICFNIGQPEGNVAMRSCCPANFD